MSTVSRNIYHDGGRSNQSAVAVIQSELTKICNKAQTRSFEFDSKPYFNVEAEIPGTNPNEIVIICAHLDSTAANEDDYDAEKDAAPGADDNGSGVAGVLAVATELMAKKAKPKRTIRFVLFNAEEYWIRGSGAYADTLDETNGISVAGVVAMDMIGWHRPGDSAVEIHSVGSDDYSDEDMRKASDALAEIVAQAATKESLIPERYPLRGIDEDPAHERSDHSSFQLYGWPAVLICEGSWTERGNRNYHKKSDLRNTLDDDYAAAIARAVARAAWTVANA